MIELQDLGVDATVSNTMDNEGESQGFVQSSKYKAGMGYMREELSSLVNVSCRMVSWKKILRCATLRRMNTELSIA
jgi:hypothetical protein